MGKPTDEPPKYRVAGSSAGEGETLSLHTTPDDYQYQDDVPHLDEDLPPAYGDEEPLTPLLVLEESGKKPLINRNGVDVIMDETFEHDSAYCERLIREWDKIPPAQLVTIKGTHTKTVKRDGKDQKETVVDFDLKLRLTEYLMNTHSGATSMWKEMVTVNNGEKAHRGTCIKRKAPLPNANDLEIQDDKPGLKEWCHRWCASHAQLKTFRYTRKVTGMDEDILRNNITRLVNRTGYCGHLRIDFPIENRAVEVWSDSKINRWRLNKWICALFYFSMLWILTWPYLFFATKRFAVVRTEWPFSQIDANGNKVYATVSEDQWFQKWKDLIKAAVIERAQGFLTEEDFARFLQICEPGPVESGNTHVDRVGNFLSAGARAYREVNRQLGWGGDC
ncbi:hypothetical protein K402DRAFT_338062 [Aulographum hederae CBS 113979]|uniref:Uncharacterized protein n=1 Tax=Aulographum hederae CBS 113979 TaxID=1176131 RepID=A0A6G1GRR9_9PEZI|nr:hypothetical protein K402DRAFT_338062 [Aulographum hederae CBS 113979]